MPYRFAVYTKPDCDYCVQAKGLLAAHDIAFTSHSLDDAEKRAAFLERLKGWRTFPVIFATDPVGKITGFVGGYEALLQKLGPAPTGSATQLDSAPAPA
jgi:glutaredoxin